MRMLNLALKDILQVTRDKKSFMFILLMPFVFTFVMGLAFSPSISDEQRLEVTVIDRDGSNVSQELKKLLKTDDRLNLTELSAAQASVASQIVKEGTYAAFITIPSGFGQTLLDDKGLPLDIVADETKSSGNDAIQIISADVEHLAASAETARLVKDQLSAPALNWQVFQNALAGWKMNHLSVEVQSAAAEPATQNSNPYSQSSPGMLIQFVVVGLMSSANIIVMERKSHTLQRMITTSMTRAEVIAGHFLAMTALVLLQELLLIIFGSVVLKVGYFNHPIATVCIALYFALWSASLGLLIGVFARSEDQAVLFSLLAMFLFTALGGAWFPLEVSGKTFSTVAHFFPTAWAMDAFQNIVQRGLGLHSVLLPTLVLLGYTLVFLALAVWRLRREA